MLLVGAVYPVLSQHAGTVKENHVLPLPIQHCTKSGGCVWEDTKVTMDANWRWIHEYEGYTNCYSGPGWSSSMCPNNTACAANCALEGVPEYQWLSTYGVSRTSDHTGVRLNFKTGNDIGSRMYMMDTDTTYKMFQLNNREITFDVDVSTLACGLNGAVYFSEMPADGDMSATNTAGAAYGTGYCDAQCPRDIKFINGEGNSEGWHTTATGRTFGTYGSCCAEMDLWEANRVDTAYTAHPCTVEKLYRCTGEDCDGQCDKAGCDFNSYRMGDRQFFGPGSEYTLDSSRPFTIVTQFITADGTDTGDLSEIRRFYMQDGKRIDNSKTSWEGLHEQTSLSDATCTLDKQIFGDEDTFAQYGGMKQMGASLSPGRGMTLVLSLWDDLDDHMRWLDSTEPAGSTHPGAARGPCAVTSGDPVQVRAQHSNAWVEYFNFKYGELDSTANQHAPGPVPTPPAPTPPSPVPSPPAPSRRRGPAPSPQPTPPSPPGPPGLGSCCWGGCGASAYSCDAGWCSESRSHCESSCSGVWCAVASTAAVGKVRRHTSLRGDAEDAAMLQSFKRHEGEAEELRDVVLSTEQGGSDEL